MPINTGIKRHIAMALERTVQQIRAAEMEYDRPRNSVRLVAVSKTRSIDEIIHAARQGQRDFGENYLQEALPKIQAVKEPEITWHFIGPIQSNKTRRIAENFAWVHGLSRLDIARRLNDARPDNAQHLNVCIQVNISGEASKSGIKTTELSDLAKQVSLLPRLRLRGLMALPLPAAGFQRQYDAFALLQRLFNEQKSQFEYWDTLSIGTTSDMKAAIAGGSTMVRIGTAIFGPRQLAV